MIELAEPDIERRSEGDVVYLASRTPLAPHPNRLGDLLRRAASIAPDRPFLLEPRGAELRQVTYAQALRASEGIASALLREGWAAAPILVLSDNSVDHALLALGCFLAGAPIAPISPAYSLRSRDYERLRFIAKKLGPKLIFCEEPERYEAALSSIELDVPILPASELREFFDERPSDALLARERSIDASTIAKVLFTSGSTGRPKGVLNTHGMLTSNQQALAQAWPFLSEQAPVLVDWLPWSHTFGGNHNFNLVLFHAGTLFIDDGKPTPELVCRTVANLRRLAPTLYFNVPAGFAALVPLLESDEAFCEHFFSRLKLLFYAGAALPNDLWHRLAALGSRSRKEPVFMTTAWGSTETSPLATSAHFALSSAGNIGVPVPGVTLKLVPNGGKTEVRVKGPNVMPGYLDDRELSEEAFDEEGYYRIGDAVKEIDGHDPNRGLLFDGRVAEDFKLTTGTWVNVGSLRTGLLAACSPVLSDCVIAGQDREFVAVLAWTSAAGCERFGGPNDERVRAHLRAALETWNGAHEGRSTRVARLSLLEEPPSIDAGEITDKGYVNQRATLERRRADVERLYAPQPDASILVVAP